MELFEIDYDNVPKAAIKVNAEKALEQEARENSTLLKSWYLHTCFNFLKLNDLKNSEERLIEDFSDFMLASLTDKK